MRYWLLACLGQPQGQMLGALRTGSVHQPLLSCSPNLEIVAHNFHECILDFRALLLPHFEHMPCAGVYLMNCLGVEKLGRAAAVSAQQRDSQVFT